MLLTISHGLAAQLCQPVDLRAVIGCMSCVEKVAITPPAAVIGPVF